MSLSNLFSIELATHLTESNDPNRFVSVKFMLHGVESGRKQLHLNSNHLANIL
jgi:hypothetical protein